MDKINWKIIAKILILIIFVGLIWFFLQHSFADIFQQVRKTKIQIVMYCMILGMSYQMIEAKNIREIVYPFQEKFTILDGLSLSVQVVFYRVISFGTGALISEVYFYRKQNLKISQGVGLTLFRLVMHRIAVVMMAFFGLLLQFSLLREKAPKLIPFIIIGILMAFFMTSILLILASSINLQVLLLRIANRIISNQKIRNWIDFCNLQVYSLRETVVTIIQDRSAMLRIFAWNLVKLFFWYFIPYTVLVVAQPQLDLLLVMSFTSFALVLASVLPAPSGVGPFEFVFLLLFKPIVGTADAVAALLIYRFSTLVLPCLIGGGVVLFHRVRAHFILNKGK